MKSLTLYIKEGLVDDILYLLDTWFMTNEIEQNEFIGICAQCSGNQSTSVDRVKELLSGTALEKNIIPFVNFIQGEVHMPDSTDYYYLFSKIVDTVTANKEDKNNYIKK